MNHGAACDSESPSDRPQERGPFRTVTGLIPVLIPTWKA